MTRALFPGHLLSVSSERQVSSRGEVEVILSLADALGVPVDLERFHRAVDETGARADTPTDALLEAARTLGLVIQSVPAHQSAEVLEHALVAKAPPLVSHLVDAQTGHPIWFLVEHRHGGRVHVRLAGQSEGLTTSRRRLLRWLEHRGHTAPWSIAELASPLAVLGVQDSERTPRPMTRLLALLRTERRDILVVVAFAVAAGVLTLATPVAVQILINTVAFASLVQPIVVLSLLLLGVLGFAAALRAMQAWVVEILQRRVFVRVVADLAHRLPHVHISAFDRASGPGLVNRFFDVLTVQKAASSLLVDGLSAALQAVVGLVLLSLYHPILLGFDVLLLASIAFILFVMGRGAQRTAIVESKKKYAIAEWLEALAAHPTAFKHAGGDALAMRQADELARGYLDARVSHFRIVFRQYVGALAMQVICGALLLGLGGWLVIEGQLTLGQLVAAELIVTSALAAMIKFSNKLDELYDLIAAMDKLGQLVDLPLERRQGLHRRPTEAPASLAVRRMGYQRNGHQILHDLDLELQPGERVAVLSASGGGKSTLGELIFGLREPTAGAVLIDGLDTRELLPHALRQDVVLVRQGQIFEGTLRNNVTLGDTRTAPERVRGALVALGLEEMLESLPQGLETRLTATGAPLSGSQAARVVLARALVKRPRLLVVDQLLDGMSEHERVQALEQLLDPDAPWTLLLMTSDPGLALRADRTVELPSR